jgi:hypothetical protein
LGEEKKEERMEEEKGLEAEGIGVLDPEISQQENEPGENGDVRFGREELAPGDEKS